MRSLFLSALLAGALLMAGPLPAQQVCVGTPYVINTPEDELMLAYNGAENVQEQIAALDKFAQEHADSRFMPCVHELYTIAYLKQNDYAKAIAEGEKALAGRPDVMLLMNLARAYVATGTATDTAFGAILQAPAAIQSEAKPSRPPNVSDDEWKKYLDETAQQAKEWRGYMEYAFFQMIQHEPDGNKRLKWLDGFAQAYPDSPNQGQLNFNYYLAYKMLNDVAKADEYGEKAVASDPNNVVTLSVIADDYATRNVNLEKAEEYAKKALELAASMKKAEGMTDEQFKAQQDSQLGLAHLALGFIAFQRNSKTKKVGPAIDEFKTASDLLTSNPTPEGRALYYLGFAYESLYPANHKAALDAFSRSAALASPWQAQAADLLEKVKKVLAR
ncbi:MAG: hypothetical protein LAN62_15545 [Acidobacteriia bacterium]|nr:hypothetical protein [Terriglobia bacterium]